MTARHFLGAIAATAFTFSAAAFGEQDQFGTADQARAMLDRAVAAVKADKDLALAQFNSGGGGFKDRDLYPFCFNVSDGKFVAAIERLLGTDARVLKDPTGKPFGAELFAAAQRPEGQVTEVSYMFPRPGADRTVAPKVTFVTKVRDLGCGVGYYK